MTKAGVFIVASCFALGACGVGDDGDTNNPNPNGLKCSAALRTTGTFEEDPTNPRPVDPAGPDGLIGTADDGTSQLGGCWPVGRWTFTATVDTAALVADADGDGDGDRCGEVAGTTAPSLEASYSFRVTRVYDDKIDGLREQYEYLGTSANFFHVKVSEGGGGDCEGIMEFKSPDSTQWWTLNPSICTSSSCNGTAINNGPITGSGDYTLYLEPQPY